MKMNVNGNVNVLIGLGRFSDAEALIKRQLEARARVLQLLKSTCVVLIRSISGTKAKRDGCCDSSAWRALQQPTRKRSRCKLRMLSYGIESNVDILGRAKVH